MGSFIGHVVPGSFFVLFGAWWIFRAIKVYLKSCTKRDQKFKCQITYPPKLRCNMDLEAALALVAAVIGMIIELLFANVLKGMPIGVGNGQHATMYFFFGLTGSIGLITPTLKYLIPNIDNLRYVALAMAYTVEGILFKFHLMGRDDLDVTVHVLLVYTISGCVIMTLLEMAFRDQVLMAIGRGYFTMLQGSWFWQVAFILYNPIPGHSEWNHEDHNHIMLTTCFYTWHMGAVFLYVLVCSIGWALILKKNGDLDDTSFTLEPVANGYRHLPNDADIETGADENTFT